jgi:acetylornithine deacetylase
VLPYATRGRPESVSFASDAGWLQSLGIECLLFGPGAIEVAHRPNEFTPKEEFHRAGGILRELIARFCA